MSKTLLTRRRGKRLFELYEKAEPTIERTVSHFIFCKGGDADEMRSEALEAFISAVDSFESGMDTTMKSWLISKIRWRLMSYWRRELKRRESTTSMGTLVDNIASRPSVEQLSREDLQERCRIDLTGDAFVVARLVIDAPTELTAVILECSPCQIRKAIRQYMKEQWGWSSTRCSDAFDVLSRI